ncbi:MAG: diguanylate cyclase (GGDEF)-like protein [Phenylobacterium sp.]|jgi:diguanylate cyclase (GGDEF)-like protein
MVSQSSESKHLLVIEDSKNVAQVIEHIGVSLGYRVTIATSFAVVKQLLALKHDFFLATIDYSLPDALDGEVIPYVLEHRIPGIVMTGRMDDKTRGKILNLPVVDYITKENTQAYHYLLRILKYQLTNNEIGVLVVDDSLTARKQVCQLLKRRNFKVYDVPDGTKALQALTQFPDIKMVITDQEMPGMDGIELLQKIRKQHTKNELIVIGISGTSKNYNSARFIKNGADDFLQKPFCPEEFYCRIMQNIEKLQHIEEIERAANTDYLTSLYNRRYFFEQAKKIAKKFKKTPEPSLLVMLDIDFFKKINDSYGHDCGDHVLIELGKLFGQYFANDLVARLGGEEFSIIMSAPDAELMACHLNTFREAVAEHAISFKEHNFNFALSMGAIQIDAEHSIEQLMSLADKALYKAKEGGRNQLVMHR